MLIHNSLSRGIKAAENLGVVVGPLLFVELGREPELRRAPRRLRLYEFIHMNSYWNSYKLWIYMNLFV